MKFHLKLLIFCLFCLNVYIQAKNTKEQGFVYMNAGRLYFPSGKELCLWGVNFQPSLSWEYNSRLKAAGIELDLEAMKALTDKSFDEIQRMGADMIRCHITPADFTDDNGNLVETIYLDLLDYVVAEAAKRNIYVYLTLINHMGSGYVNNSMWYTLKYPEWIFNKEVVRKSSNYITQLLNRENSYSGIKYSATPNIALWEMINEPRFYSYKEIKDTPYYNEFKDYCKKKNLEDIEPIYFDYRKELVLNYLNGIHDVIRKTGAKQPVVWNCNWPRMRMGLEDVFEAIANSKVEVVSFCNYPGQDVCKNPYYANPENLTKYDYSQFFSNCYNKADWLGWTLTPAFKDKAKVVYEYEALYNQSQSVYPAMAQLFRGLGAQVAAMWTYSLNGYAQYANGSHNLSITCTPAKAASFRVAKEIFSTLPLFVDYKTLQPMNEKNDNYIISFSEDLSVFSSDDKLCYTHDILDSKIRQSPQVKEIHGRGNSKLVQYDGAGLYNVYIAKNEIQFTIEPDALAVKEIWQVYKDKSIVTVLDYQRLHKLSIELEAFPANEYALYKVIEGKKNKIALLTDFKNMTVNSGAYVIERLNKQ